MKLLIIFGLSISLVAFGMPTPAQAINSINKTTVTLEEAYKASSTRNRGRPGLAYLTRNRGQREAQIRGVERRRSLNKVRGNGHKTVSNIVNQNDTRDYYRKARFQRRR